MFAIPKSFTVAEFVRTMDSCKMLQPKPKEVEKDTKIPIDWQARKQQKWLIFRKFAAALVIIVVSSLVCIVTPLWIVDEALGKAFLISIPPMFLVTLSWMIATWKFRDDRRFFLLASTVGMMPVRIIAVTMFTMMLVWYSDVVIAAFVIGMMIHWVLFAVPEMGMMLQLTKLRPTAEEEPA